MGLGELEPPLLGLVGTEFCTKGSVVS
jgi:hypothetical protein